MTLDCRPDKAHQRRHPARLRALTPDGASLISLRDYASPTDPE
ncbi:hypothetical protein SF123566_3981 [Shigella flexneri 1235-66]|nr:hypothetical protein SF123566_3981 [Shigella flexneri 1235-66]